MVKPSHIDFEVLFGTVRAAIAQGDGEPLARQVVATRKATEDETNLRALFRLCTNAADNPEG